jgi:hypothetical protein
LCFLLIWKRILENGAVGVRVAKKKKTILAKFSQFWLFSFFQNG